VPEQFWWAPGINPGQTKPKYEHLFLNGLQTDKNLSKERLTG